MATDVSSLDLEAMLLKDSAEDERDKELCKASDQKIQSFLDQIFPADDEKPQQNGHHKQNQVLKTILLIVRQPQVHFVHIRERFVIIITISILFEFLNKRRSSGN